MTRHDDLYALPSGLPVPDDDGACRHLIGMRVPAIALPSTSGSPVRLDDKAAAWTAVYLYPRTGHPDRNAADVLDWLDRQPTKFVRER